MTKINLDYHFLCVRARGKLRQGNDQRLGEDHPQRVDQRNDGPKKHDNRAQTNDSDLTLDGDMLMAYQGERVKAEKGHNLDL